MERLKRENAMLKKVFENLDAGGVTRKYGVVEKAAQDYNVSEHCKLLGVSRSGYYAFRKRKQADRDKPLKDLIRNVYQAYDGKY
jgi:putative transposase